MTRLKSACVVIRQNYPDRSDYSQTSKEDCTTVAIFAVYLSWNYFFFFFFNYRSGLPFSCFNISIHPLFQKTQGKTPGSFLRQPQPEGLQRQRLRPHVQIDSPPPVQPSIPKGKSFYLLLVYPPPRSFVSVMRRCI